MNKVEQKAWISGCTRQLVTELYELKKSGKISSTNLDKMSKEILGFMVNGDLDKLPASIANAGREALLQVA